MGNKTPWYDDDNPARTARGASWRLAIGVVGIIVFFGLLGAGIWTVRVVTSGVKGAGDATAQINSAPNRIANQEHFHNLMADILKSDRNLDRAAENQASHPDDDYFVINYTGLVAHCNDVIAQYNADALKVSKAKWLDPSLPQQIDRTNPDTDCKENAK